MSLSGMLTESAEVFVPILTDDLQGGETVTYPTTPNATVRARLSRRGAAQAEHGQRTESRVDAYLYSAFEPLIARGTRIRTGETGTFWSDGSSWSDGSYWADEGGTLFTWEVDAVVNFDSLTGFHHQRASLRRVDAGV